MNEIKKCPFCEWDAYAEISVNDGYVQAVMGCKGCEARFKTAVSLSDFENIVDAIEYAFSVVLEQWNKRAEEPQEHKESNVEWALNEIKKGTFFYNVCNLAHLTKWYVPCVEEDCGECEFRDKKHAINYLLAPHED